MTASTWAGLQVVTESEKSPLEWRPESTRHISRPTLGQTGTYRLCQANTPPHCPTQAAQLNVTTITDNSLLRRTLLAKYWASRCFVPSAAQSLILQPSDYVICVNTVIFLTINWQYFPHWCFLWRWTVQWWERQVDRRPTEPVHLLHVSLCLCLTALSNPSSLTTFPHVPAFVLSLLI